MRSGSPSPRMGDAQTDVGTDLGDAGAVGVSSQDRDPAFRECACDPTDCQACR